MNDCLPHAGTGRQRATTDADVFEKAFADAPDLTHLTYAARRVLSMSAALFYQRGAAATSIRDITRACGLSPGALYNHFASKDDVLYELVRHGHERLERRIAAALEGSTDDPTARVAAFVHAYVMGHLVQPELAQVVRREYLHLSPARYQETVRRRRVLRDQLTDVLRAGAGDGSFDLIGGRDGSTRVAVMVLDMCARTSDWYDPSREDPPSEFADRYVTAALRLAGARPVG
jgi:TetR/AcrR family transcriptional regulator, cholesterol catabolism regulator